MRMRNDHPRIRQEALNYYSGYKGELSLDYYLKFINDQSNLILHDLRLPYIKSYYQIDTLMMIQTFFLILEVKNHANFIRFDHKNGVMYQGDKKYEDPVGQAQAQVHQLKSSLHKLGIRDMPVKFLVVFTNPKAILSEEKDERVIYSHQLLQKFEELSNENQTSFIQMPQLNAIANQLITQNKPLQSDMFKQLGILPQNLKLGVICPSCQHLHMIRKHGHWFCPKCQIKSHTAHLRSLFEYQLLFNSQITNRQFRKLCNIESIKTASRLLMSSGLPHIGEHRHRIYHLNYNLQQDGRYLLDYFDKLNFRE